MTPRLQINDTQGKRVVPLDKPLFRIGRRTESDLRVSGVDVSREHAEVEQGDNGGWLLRDRGSRCGTFVNNEPVTERVLRHGDQIRLGMKSGAELVFLLDGSGVDPRAPALRRSPISGRWHPCSMACAPWDRRGCSTTCWRS